MWNRQEALSVCIELPGPESDAIAERAKRYGCWISFGAYVRDPDWPGHVLSITSLIDPNGTIVAKHWKARNIRGVFPGFELFTTTIENVLDRYTEMYGIDAVIPVARTSIGNISLSAVQRNPELFRAMAMKGAEIFLRTASGGFTSADVSMTSSYNSVYSVIVNNAVSPGNPGFFEDSNGGSGHTAIYGPRGETLAEAKSAFEQTVEAVIPIAAFRSTHTIPDVDVALYQPVWNAYTPRFDHSAFTAGSPESLADAKRILSSQDRWT
jgi:predicted amidohydrolase